MPLDWTTPAGLIAAIKVSSNNIPDDKKGEAKQVIEAQLAAGVSDQNAQAFIRDLCAAMKITDKDAFKTKLHVALSFSYDADVRLEKIGKALFP